MLRHRVIPCLLLKGSGLVKTVRFGSPRYIGDPINAVKLFNDLAVDELLFLDIMATREGRSPDLHRLGELASEAFMPLAYGGGVRNVESASTLLQLGIEKVAITTAALERPRLISELARACGSQSVIVGIDVRRGWFKRVSLRSWGGRKRHSRDPVEFAREAQDLGAGELLLTAIDRDGTLEGYDLEMIQRVSEAVEIPLIACGGAGCVADLGRAVRAGASAAAAGSLFVYSGPRRAVLINYPSQADLRAILGD